MVAIYTNSKERAIRIASILGGISVENTVLRLDDVHTHMEQLLDLIGREGYLVTFFNSDIYVVMYSNDIPAVPSKMSEYNQAYAKIGARPVPFFPEEIRYTLVDQEFADHLEIYRRLFDENSIRTLINAASDDIEGEYAFGLFLKFLDRPTPPVSRARILAMRGAQTISAFNILSSQKKDYEYTARARAEMDWLVSCNLTNYLYRLTGQVLVTGRIESALLYGISILTERRKRSHWSLCAHIQGDTPTGDHFDMEVIHRGTGALSKPAVERLAGELDRSGFIQSTSSEWVKNAHDPLYNIFTLQCDAADLLDCSLQEASESIITLYDKGYITWPTDHDSIPWRAKNFYAGSIAALSNLEEYSERVRPTEVDNYFGWDPEPRRRCSDATGIFVTDKPPSKEELDEATLKIYHLIAENNIRVLESERAEARATLSVKIGKRSFYGEQLLAVGNPILSEDEKKRAQLIMAIGDCQESQTVQVTDIKVMEDVQETPPLTESALVRFMLPFLDDTYCNSRSFFTKPLANLRDWGLISKVDNELRLTEVGERVVDFISDTTLSDFKEAFDWERRFNQVIHGTMRPELTPDFQAYINDVLTELTGRDTLLKECDGVNPSGILCPRCGYPIHKRDEVWACDNAECAFHVRPSVYGHEIQWRDMQQLVRDGKTSSIRDFKSKKGATFTAKLELTEDLKIRLSFDTPYNCPKCGEMMQTWAWGIRCSSKSCGFHLNTQVCGVTLRDEEIHAILSGQETELIKGFVNKSGKRFSAQLYLDASFAVKFKFPRKRIYNILKGPI